jgi:hypothetical protein
MKHFMFRSLVLSSLALAACVAPNQAEQFNETSSDPLYGSSEAALEASGQPALDISKLPAGSEVLEDTPPGALMAVIPLSATCPSGAVCIFQNSNRGGARLAISLAAGVGINLTNFGCSACTNGIHGNDGSWNDQMSSWENAAGVNYCWAVNINGGGTRHLMRASVSLQNLLSSENDTASSIVRSSTNCL